MSTLLPETPEQLAESLQDAASAHRTIRLGGNFSKDRLGGAPQPADVVISTSRLNRLLQYDPRDLTVSVQAGMRFAELEQILAGHRQMLPLDPGWAADSTVGGVVAANLSGPRRRLYGTARDMIIGMTFVTLEGKMISSGGMVVKNVAGLDMAKLMIGSFGTLAAISQVNFKVFPVPTESRSFLMEFPTAAAAFSERDRILRGVLQPSAIDIVNWPSGYRMLVHAGGNAKALERYARELPAAQPCAESVWEEIREFTPGFLAANPEGCVVPVPAKLTDMPALVEKLNVRVIVRAASGVVYAHYAHRPSEFESSVEDSAMMTNVKEMFDPERLLNRGRLYGRL
ncbi:MAG TPA: FAD-binding protein [Bryobacteraceae bacterium]|jgi:glycolate oxidase FAD binding subunit